MSTTTTNYGLIKPDTTDPILVGQLNDNADVIDATLKSLSDALDVAKLGIKYKGEVNYYSNLPSSGNQIGDAYTVKYAGSSGTTPDGTEYVWGTVSGTNQWINFSKDSYTKAEVDALLALKVDTAGTGLSKSGTTLNHSNSTTAKTTQGFAQIAYDAQGHITGSTAATTAQANAINSGIDSTKVEQIETNKNNIFLVEQLNGTKNYINYTLATLKTLNTSGTWVDNVYTLNNVTFTVNSDMSITVNGTPSAVTNFELCTTIKQGGADMVLSADVYNDYYLLALQRTGTPQYVVCNIGSKDFSDSSSVQRVYIQVRTGEGATPPTNARFQPMISEKSVYDAGFTNYQPYAMSNVELTAVIQAIQAQLANQ